MSVTAPSSAPSALVSALRNVLPDAQILVDEAERLVYEADGYLVERRIPDLVVFPHSAEQLAAVLKACQEQKVSVIPRGAGTSLAGGCLPVGGGVMVCLSQMRTILMHFLMTTPIVMIRVPLRNLILTHYSI